MQQTIINNLKGYTLLIIAITTIIALSIASKISRFSGSYTASFTNMEDGSCLKEGVAKSAIKSYLMTSVLKDTDSYKPINWSILSRNANGTYQITHTFNARDSHGIYQVRTMVFTIAPDGKSILKDYILY